ncbi:hypothetical protein XENOCAPTIV_015675, partial [Xenoophorus captivus]
KAQANEQRYTKLKEKYTELVQSHADLLRKVSRTRRAASHPSVSLLQFYEASEFGPMLFVQNAEVTRQVTVARAAHDEVEAVRREMQEKVKSAQEAADKQVKTREMFNI